MIYIFCAIKIRLGKRKQTWMAQQIFQQQQQQQRQVLVMEFLN